MYYIDDPISSYFPEDLGQVNNVETPPPLTFTSKN